MPHLTTACLVDEEVTGSQTISLFNVEIAGIFSDQVVDGMLTVVQAQVQQKLSELNEDLANARASKTAEENLKNAKLDRVGKEYEVTDLLDHYQAIVNLEARITQLTGQIESLMGRGATAYKVTVFNGQVYAIFADSPLIGNFQDVVLKEAHEDRVPAVINLYDIIQNTVEGIGAAPAA